MAEDINKHLLTQFYGFHEDPNIARFLTSSRGIESFENVIEVECLSTERSFSFDRTGKDQVCFFFNIYLTCIFYV